MKIGITQNPNSLDWKKNYKEAVSTIKYFSRQKVDLVCFQEAYLSGYGKVFDKDFSELDQYISNIKELAYELGITVFLPSLIKKSSKFYSVCYVFNTDKGDLHIYKKNLTKSEKTVMTGKKSKRRFKVDGVDIGVITCIEMEDKPFTHFSKNNMPDLILWPGYWGWNYHSKWGPINYTDGKRNKAFFTVKKQKTPVVQINMSTTFDKKGLVKRYGKSVIVNSACKRVAVGAYGKKERMVVNFEEGILKKISSKVLESARHR